MLTPKTDKPTPPCLLNVPRARVRHGYKPNAEHISTRDGFLLALRDTVWTGAIHTKGKAVATPTESGVFSRPEFGNVASGHVHSLGLGVPVP